MEKIKRHKRIVSFIAIILVVAFTNITISPEYLALECVRGSSATLNPVLASSDWASSQAPILECSRGDELMLGTAILEEVMENPEAMVSEAELSDNLLSRREGNTIEVFFSRSVKFDESDFIFDMEFSSIKVIPARIQGKKYYANLYQYRNGERKITVYAAVDASFHVGELEDLVGRQSLVGVFTELNFTDDAVYYFDNTDDGVRAAVSFLEGAGAKGVSEVLLSRIKKKKFRFVREGITSGPDVIAMSIDDEKESAAVILDDVLRHNKVNFEFFRGAFDNFWKMWLKGRSESFNIEEVAPDLKAIILEAEDRLGSASNEGDLIFREKAYTHMIDVSDIDILDCLDVRRDIETTFLKVAQHDTIKHDIEVVAGEKMHSADPDHVMGIDSSKIKYVKFLDALLPTDVVKEDKEILVNENFVKVMHKFRGIMKGGKGQIPPMPGLEEALGFEVPMGELYDSILYSLAIHTIRGHFPINTRGYGVFFPYEIYAQGDRGDKHLYTNVLAMLYYWVVIVERNMDPEARTRRFLDQFGFLLNGFDEEVRDEVKGFLIRHMGLLCTKLIENDAFPFPLEEELLETGLTGEEVNDYIKQKYPGAASNEGIFNEGPMEFMDLAYTRMPDVKDMEMWECGDTKKRIIEVFRNTIEHEIDKFNLKAVENEMDRSDIIISEEKIKFEYITECLLPSVKVRKNGEVIVSENFVKVMELLRRRGAADPVKGAMAPVGEEGATTLFDSILYSVAIHEVRGHFPINEFGFGQFNRDETKAQPVRGNKFLYNNVLAMLYYWFYVVESTGLGAQRVVKFDEYESSFVDKFPEIFRDLSKEQRGQLKRDLKEFHKKMVKNEIALNYGNYVDTGTTKKEVQELLEADGEDVVWNEGMSSHIDPRELPQPVDILKTMYENGGEMTAGEITKLLGSSANWAVHGALFVLNDIGIVEQAERKKDDGSKEYFYKIVLLSGEQFDKALNEIKGLEVYTRTPNIAQMRNRLKPIIERKWAYSVRDLLSADDKTEKTSKADSAKGKMVLAIEDEWFQENAFGDNVQTIVQMVDQLSKKGPVRIVRGSSKEIASLMENAKEEEKVAWSKVVVLASHKTIGSREFKPYVSIDADDMEKPLLIGVDTAKLGSEFYIGILEMITMAIRMGRGQKIHFKNSNIKIEGRGRTFYFLPSVDPLDFEAIRRIYKAQEAILKAA